MTCVAAQLTGSVDLLVPLVPSGMRSIRTKLILASGEKCDKILRGRAIHPWVARGYTAVARSKTWHDKQTFVDIAAACSDFLLYLQTPYSVR